MSLLALALFGLGPAVAGPLPLAVSPGARLQVLPPEAGRVDVIVYDNDLDLRAQVAELHHPSLRAARAVDTGATWVLSFYFKDTHTGLDPAPGGLEVVPRAAGPRVDLPGVDATSAVAHPPPAGACTASPPALRALSLAHWRWTDQALSSTVEVPVWTEAEPRTGGWGAVDEARELLARRAAPRAPTLYRLGALHRDLGHLREAAWYFGEAAEAGDHAGTSQLQRALALVRVGQLELAVRAARSAVNRGASPEAALHVVALATWLQRAPDAHDYGAALAVNAHTPGARLLAGVVLVGAGCHELATGLLATAEPALPAAAQDVARMALAEAQLGLGEHLAAASTLARVSKRGLSTDVSALARTRARLADLGPRSALAWLAHAPDLRRDGRAPGPAGAEALYVLAQVYAAGGDDREAVGALAELARRYPHLVPGEAGRALAEAWARRTTQLLAAGRAIDAVMLHRGAWRDDLVEHLSDLGPLAAMAQALGEQGLPDHALDAWRTVAEAQAARGLPSHDAVLALARLFVERGATDDALDALGWLRRHHPPSDVHAELASLETRARGQRAPAAVVDCPAASPTPGTRPEAICTKITEEEARQSEFVAVLGKKTSVRR